MGYRDDLKQSVVNKTIEQAQSNASWYHSQYEQAAGVNDTATMQAALPPSAVPRQ